MFNVLFVLNRKGEYRVYCHKCAGAIRKPFTVLQQVRVREGVGGWVDWWGDEWVGG